MTDTDGTCVQTTVSARLLSAPFAFAVIVVSPSFISVTLPPSTVATDGSDEVHTIASVMLVSVGSSDNVSYSSIVFDAIPRSITLSVTLNSTVAEISPMAAVTIAEPSPTPCTTPLYTVTTAASEVLHTMSSLFSFSTVGSSLTL